MFAETNLSHWYIFKVLQWSRVLHSGLKGVVAWQSDDVILSGYSIANLIYQCIQFIYLVYNAKVS